MNEQIEGGKTGHPRPQVSPLLGQKGGGGAPQVELDTCGRGPGQGEFKDARLVWPETAVLDLGRGAPERHRPLRLAPLGALQRGGQRRPAEFAPDYGTRLSLAVEPLLAREQVGGLGSPRADGFDHQQQALEPVTRGNGVPCAPVLKRDRDLQRISRAARDHVHGDGLAHERGIFAACKAVLVNLGQGPEARSGRGNLRAAVLAVVASDIIKGVGRHMAGLALAVVGPRPGKACLAPFAVGALTQNAIIEGVLVAAGAKGPCLEQRVVARAHEQVADVGERTKDMLHVAGHPLIGQVGPVHADGAREAGFLGVGNGTLDDQENSERYYIIDESLYENIKSIFSKNNFVHLILQINYLPENDIYIIADSLIQKGWIKNKGL